VKSVNSSALLAMLAAVVGVVLFSVPSIARALCGQARGESRTVHRRRQPIAIWVARRTLRPAPDRSAAAHSRGAVSTATGERAGISWHLSRDSDLWRTLGTPMIRSGCELPGDLPASEDIDAILLDIVGAAQRAFPTFELPRDVFVAYLRERIPADVQPPVALRQMYTSDLYLACGCARGNVRAFAVFDDHCLAPLDRILGKMGIGADVSADVKQDIRGRVLVGSGGRAQIVDFAGRGDLRGWVRVMAVRQALQRQCGRRRELPVEDDELLQRIVAPGTLELDHTKRRYQQEFKRAFDDALRALPERERTLLRQHHVDGLSIDEIAVLYRVHRSTAARLLVRARLRVLEATRARMMSELDVRSHDLDSILRMIRSQIEISLRGLRHRRRR